MNFEVINPAESAEPENRPSWQGRDHIGFDERMGGPLKPNDLLTTDIGADRSKPILARLNVQYKMELCSPEIRLNDRASAPAEYRIEIMDPDRSDEPARQAYVRFVMNVLKDAGVPISGVATEPAELDNQ